MTNAPTKRSVKTSEPLSCIHSCILHKMFYIKYYRRFFFRQGYESIKNNVLNEMETHRVLMVGPPRTGKTTLCVLWSGGVQPQSYLSTISAERHECHIHSEYKLALYEMPSSSRFFDNLERFYARSDIVVLVVCEDTPSDCIYERIAPWAPLASWLLMWTSSSACPKWRAWAAARQIQVCVVDLSSKTSVNDGLDCVVTLCQCHAPRRVLSFASDVARLSPCG